MTKPSYEELKKLAEKARDFVPAPLKCMDCGKPTSTGPMASGAIWMDRCPKAPTPNQSHTYQMIVGPIVNDATRFADAANPQAILDLLAELARVRGLLQHVVHSVIFFVEGFPANDCSHTRQRASHLVDELGDARRELSRPSGAESADIGKLDTADEKDEGIFGDCPVCNCLAKGREE